MADQNDAAKPDDIEDADGLKETDIVEGDDENVEDKDVEDEDKNEDEDDGPEDEEELFFTEKLMAPAAIAQQLRTFADQLEQGSMSLDDETFDIPEYVALKIELEEEHNGDIAPVNFEIEVEITWPVRMQED